MNKLLNNKLLLIGLGVIALIGLLFITINATQNLPASAPAPTQTPLQPKAATIPPPVKDKPVPGRIIIKFKPQYTQAQINEHLKQYNASIIKNIEGINQTVVKVPAGQEDTIIKQLQNDPYIQTSQRDYTTHAFFVPNDPGFTVQYALNNTGQAVLGHTGKAQADIRVESAWDVTKGNGVRVAILDTGINLNQPDLAGKVIAGKWFTSGGPSSVEDGNGHGTHVAGIIAADTNNGMGVAGVCPGCQLIIVKVLDDSGAGTTSDATAGITWAADQGAKVINMSLGTTDPQTESLYAQAINYALSKGAIVVAAAGNDGTNEPNYPAAVPGVVSVAATTNTDQKASYSNYGSSVQIAAPGDNILSTGPTHSFQLEPFGYNFSSPYMYLSGTSMAAPVVSGVAALVASTSYGTTAQALINRLYTTADKIAGTGSFWTNGRIDAAAAVGPAPTAIPAPTAALITPTVYCVGGNGTPPCATIPANSTSPNGTGPTVAIGSPVSGGNKANAVPSTAAPSTAASNAPSPSPAASNPNSGTGPVCNQITNLFYNFAPAPQSQANSSKVHIKCEPSKGGSDKNGKGGGNGSVNPNNGWLSKFIAFLMQLISQLLQLCGVQTPPSGTPTISGVPSNAPSTAPSISPAPSASTTVSHAPSARIIPVSNINCGYRDDTWDPGDAATVGYTITDLSSKNGNPASFSVKLNAKAGTTRVVAYPNVQCILTSLIPSNLTSSFNITPPANSSGLDYEFAYDFWINTATAINSSNPWLGNQEIMIWTYNNGQRPAGSVEGTLSDGSQVWGEGSTTNGVGPVSVVLPHNETSGTVNLSSILSELRSKGYINNADTGIDDVEYGIEAPDGGGQTFTVNSLSVTE